MKLCTHIFQKARLAKYFFVYSQEKVIEDRNVTLYAIMGHGYGFRQSRRGFSKEGLDVPDYKYLEYILLEKDDIVRLHLHY